MNARTPFKLRLQSARHVNSYVQCAREAEHPNVMTSLKRSLAGLPEKLLPAREWAGYGQAHFATKPNATQTYEPSVSVPRVGRSSGPNVETEESSSEQARLEIRSNAILNRLALGAELRTSLAHALSPDFSSCSSSCGGICVATTSAAQGFFPCSWSEAWSYQGWRTCSSPK